MMVLSGNDVDFTPPFMRRFDTNLSLVCKAVRKSIGRSTEREPVSDQHQYGGVPLFDPEDLSRFG